MEATPSSMLATQHARADQWTESIRGSWRAVRPMLPKIAPWPPNERGYVGEITGQLTYGYCNSIARREMCILPGKHLVIRPSIDVPVLLLQCIRVDQAAEVKYVSPEEAKSRLAVLTACGGDESENARDESECERQRR